MKKYAERHNTAFRFDTNILPKFDKSREPLQYRLTPRKAASLNWISHGTNALKKHPDICRGGTISFLIDPHGNLTMCLPFRESNQNLRDVPFKQAWQDLDPIAQERPRNAEECRSCEVQDVCDQCPAWAYVEMGTRDAKVEFVCQFTKLLHDFTNRKPKNESKGGETDEQERI
jgi:radical SAM protein with 4Fe4S-binding SPASM domain